MPSVNHSAVQVNLIVEFAKHREYRTHSELTIELGERSFTPDLSVYPRQAINLMLDVVRKQEPPLVTVEIFSPRKVRKKS